MDNEESLSLEIMELDIKLSECDSRIAELERERDNLRARLDAMPHAPTCAREYAIRRGPRLPMDAPPCDCPKSDEWKP